MSLVVRKPIFGVSDQVRHVPGCTATEDGKRLEILYLGSRGIVRSDLRLCFRICNKQIQRIYVPRQEFFLRNKESSENVKFIRGVTQSQGAYCLHMLIVIMPEK